MANKLDIERTLTSIALVLIIISTLFDIIEDYQEGATSFEVFMDLCVSGFIVFTLIYIWKFRPRAKAQENKNLRHLMHATDNDLALWKSKASRLLEGLGTQISEQFDLWGLTTTEKEVAILLIKGISLKEIAGIRGRSEKTVRQQASNIYAKANIENRASLSAFFLEDLLLPGEPAVNHKR
ncbi:MAG: helix-turn-helix transcriptional regulator [Arenicella sp.]